ncbi:MAG: hypothetical protein ABGZ17_24105, partial [Planctomycetaceae bacterium]
PFNNLTARKFVLDVSPEEFSIAAHSAAEEGAILYFGKNICKIPLPYSILKSTTSLYVVVSNQYDVISDAPPS